MIELPLTPVKYYVAVAKGGKHHGTYWISNGGDKWMRLKNQRYHFWQHAMERTQGRVASLKPGEYVTFKTACTGCARDCYQENPLEFYPTAVFYSVSSIS